MAELWAVDGDPNTHGGGGLIAGHGSTVKINGLAVIVHGPDLANADDLDDPNPDTAAGSGTVKCYGFPVHRNGDLRTCGATTTVVGQGTVKVG
jgi:uncharacterized Zn-binding protein involved in type VI secretion